MLASESGAPRGKEQPAKYDAGKQAGNGALASAPKAYNTAADAVPAANGAEKPKKEKVSSCTHASWLAPVLISSCTNKHVMRQDRRAHVT